MSNNLPTAIALPVSTLAIAAANGATLMLPIAAGTPLQAAAPQVPNTQALAELAHREYQV